MKTASQDNWAAAFYEETPFEYYMRRDDPAALNSTLDFLLARLNLTKGSLLFDQCCGMGSISIPMAKRGISIIGVDLCGKYIKTAQTDAAMGDLPCEFFQGDAGQFVTPGPCDAAINWWTSFGYSIDDENNKAMLMRVFESLKPGGWFALDYPNFCHYLTQFKTAEVNRYKHNDGEVTVLRETTIELPAGLRRQLWTFLMPDGKKLVHDTHLKIYMPDTIQAMLKSCGFKEIECLDGTSGNPVTFNSTRCTFIAQRQQ